jgi:hypothetical protein
LISKYGNQITFADTKKVSDTPGGARCVTVKVAGETFPRIKSHYAWDGGRPGAPSEAGAAAEKSARQGFGKELNEQTNRQ